MGCCWQHQTHQSACKLLRSSPQFRCIDSLLTVTRAKPLYARFFGIFFWNRHAVHRWPGPCGYRMHGMHAIFILLLYAAPFSAHVSLSKCLIATALHWTQNVQHPCPHGHTPHMFCAQAQILTLWKWLCTVCVCGVCAAWWWWGCGGVSCDVV